MIIRKTTETPILKNRFVSLTLIEIIQAISMISMFLSLISGIYYKHINWMWFVVSAGITLLAILVYATLTASLIRSNQTSDGDGYDEVVEETITNTLTGDAKTEIFVDDGKKLKFKRL